MSVVIPEWLQRARTSALRIPYFSYLALWFSITSRYPFGTNVYERAWDALILLDTCRVDALCEVAPEFDFIDAAELGSITSVGSGSAEWIANTFVEAYRADVEETVYVSENGYSRHILERGQHFPTEKVPVDLADWRTLSAEAFRLHHEIWDYAPEPLRPGYLDPTITTDRAITAAREYDPERLVVHYSRPHQPYAARAIEEGRPLDRHEERPFRELSRGAVERDVVWELYLNELRVVLRQVETLLSNLDAETVVVSADHGDAFGEWGVHRHPLGVLHPHVRRVPWVETTAEDTGGYEPRYPLAEADQFADEPDEAEVEERLRQLGYA